MGPFDIVVVVVISVAVIGVIAGIIYRKVKHKGGCCGCDCGTCNGCSHCNGEGKK